MIKKRVVVIILFHISYLSAFTEVYFTPRDDIRSHLIQIINEERKSIDGAVYMLTDKTIAQSLADAFVRGVKIRLVLDQISMGERYGKGLWLAARGIAIFVHTASSINQFLMPLMHHKFFIFGWNARLQSSLVWSGSFNCTASASTIHDENVFITSDPYVIAQYRECFSMLSQKLQKQGQLTRDSLECDNV